jgi:hypothetical protein
LLQHHRGFLFFFLTHAAKNVHKNTALCGQANQFKIKP